MQDKETLKTLQQTYNCCNNTTVSINVPGEYYSDVEKKKP